LPPLKKVPPVAPRRQVLPPVTSDKPTS
jgi:hypothetical protein